MNGGFVASGTVGSTPLTISASSNLAALTVGTYTGTVAITTADGGSGNVIVTATVTGTNSGSLTISPSPISLSAALNGATSQSSVSITSAVSGTLSASVSGTGLTVSVPTSSVTAGVPTSITVFGNPAGLGSGTYTGTLVVNVAGNSASAQINFVVGTGSSGASTAAAPTQLNFFYEQNTSMPVSQNQSVYLSGSGNYSLSSNVAWLTVSPSSGTLPTTVTVTSAVTGLASGTYNGQITFTNTTNSQTALIGVTLTVTGVTTLYASPGDWVFSYIANVSSVVQSQQITVLASDGSIVPIAASVINASTTPWLTVSGGGATPSGLSVTTNASNLANGIYSGSVSVTGGGNALTVPIVLVVAGSSVSGTGSLTLGSSALSLQAPVNGSAVSQTLSVGAATSTVFTVTAQGSYNGIAWLSVSPFGTNTAPTTLTVTANPAGLPAGNYSGSLSLVANGTTQTVQVTLVVGSATGNTVSVTANGGTSTSPTLTFSAPSPGATVPTQYISISSPAGQSSVGFTISASTTSGGNWIQLNTAIGAAVHNAAHSRQCNCEHYRPGCRNL